MRDPSDYFYLYFIFFISISTFIILLVSNKEMKEEIEGIKSWLKRVFK